MRFIRLLNHALAERWRRHVASVPTVPQAVFDVYATTVVPWLCLTLDPMLFRNSAVADASTLEPAFSGSWRTAFYLFVFVEVLTANAWNVMQATRSRVLRGVVHGVLSLGSGVALLAAVPLSQLGLLLLGLWLFDHPGSHDAPWQDARLMFGLPMMSLAGTAFSFTRLATRASRLPGEDGKRVGPVLPVVSALVLAASLLLATKMVSRTIQSNMNLLMFADRSRATEAVAALARLRWFVDLEPLRRAWPREHTPWRKGLIEYAFERVTLGGRVNASD